MTLLEDGSAVTDPGGHDPTKMVVAAVTAAARDGLPVELIRAAVDLAAGEGSANGLAPVPSADEIRVLAGLAVTLTAAGNVPKAIRDKPNDAFLVMLEGRSLGLAPTTALRTLHVIDGKVTVPPMTKLAQLHRAGFGRAWKDPGSDEHGARWFATRVDEQAAGVDTVHSSAFTWDDARRAELADRRCTTPDDHAKVGNSACGCKDNWRKYPARMLSWRALGYLLDDVFPEVGAGLYSPDELGAVTDEDGRAIDVTGWEAPQGLDRAKAATPAAPKPPPEMAGDGDVVELRRAAAALERQDPEGYADLIAWWGNAGTGGSKLEPGLCTAVAERAARARLTMYARKLSMTVEELAGIWPADEFEIGDSDPGAGPIDPEPVDDRERPTGDETVTEAETLNRAGGGEVPDGVDAGAAVGPTPGRCTVPDCTALEAPGSPGLCVEHEPF